MKFKSNKSMFNVYGYDFPIGKVVEVNDKNLIAKFKTYTFLTEVRAKRGNKGRIEKSSPTDNGNIEDRPISTI